MTTPELSIHDQRPGIAAAKLARSWLPALALLFASACAASSGSRTAPEWRGDPAAVAAAGPLLAERAEELRGVRMLEAVCQRTDRAADGATRGVDDGRLFARRSTPCVVMNVTMPKPRVVREDSKTRLVLEPHSRGATRWTFASNSRGVLAVAAVFLDLAVLSKEFDITAVTAAPAVDARATRVVLTPRPGADTPTLVERLELVLIPGQAVPRLVTVVGRGGDQVEYRIQRPALDPQWRDPEARFRVEVPADYALQELTGQ
jgi:hypothetical protein